MIPPNQGKIDEQILSEIIKIARLTRRHIATIVSPQHQLTILQLEILMYLFGNSKRKSGDVARYFNTNKSTVSSQLNKLEEMKLIVRTRDDDDHRIDWITLTALGKRFLSKGTEERNRKATKLLNLIPESDKKQLLSILNTLSKSLKNSL